MKIKQGSFFLMAALAGLGFVATCKERSTTKSSHSGAASESSGESESTGSSANSSESGEFSIVGNPLSGVGPADPYSGYPRWYQEAYQPGPNDTLVPGARVDLCHDADPNCILPPFDTTLPSRFPENFPVESFYWSAVNILPITTGGTIKVLFAIEAAFSLGAAMPGKRITFGRTRFVGRGLKNGVYKITHPYGVHELDVADDTNTALGLPANGSIFFTDDVGVGAETYTGVLNSPFGTLLKWDVGAPAGYLGSAGTPHAFVGSPYGTNYYKIEKLVADTAAIVASSAVSSIGGRYSKNNISVSPTGTKFGVNPITAVPTTVIVPNSGTYTSPPTVTMAGNDSATPAVPAVLGGNGAVIIPALAAVPTTGIIYSYVYEGKALPAVTGRLVGPGAVRLLPPGIGADAPYTIVLTTSPTNGVNPVTSKTTYKIVPTFMSVSASPPAGNYPTQTTPIPITVSLAKEGGPVGGTTAIWYTLDGTDPRTALNPLVYDAAAPIVISNNGVTNVNYASVVVGSVPLNASAMNSAFYTLGGPRFSRSEIDQSIEMPFIVKDTSGQSVTTCWAPEDANCLAAGPEVDLTRPVIWPRNFATESFMWNATNVVTTLPAGGALAKPGRATLVLAIEGAYLSPTVVPGSRILFGRIRMRIDVAVAGHYRVTHPYGTDHFDVATPGINAINMSEDVTPSEGNFDLFRFGRIGPLLKWDPAFGAAPAGYLGNPGIPHEVTGSPFNTNTFKVERLDPVTGEYTLYFESTKFTVAGKIAPNSLDVAASPMGAFYSEPRVVQLIPSNANASVYYTLDGTNPTTSSTMYTAALTISNTTTVKYFAKLADGTTSTIKSDTYTLPIVKAPLVVSATPVGGKFLDVAAGTSITLSVLRGTAPAESTVRIFYTVDGSSPLLSAAQILYGAPFVVRGPAPVVLRTVAVGDDGVPSLEITNRYVFTQVLPTVIAPNNDFIAGSSLSSPYITVNPIGTVPVRISWSGATLAPLKITKFLLNKKVNAGGFVAQTLPAITVPETPLAGILTSQITAGATNTFNVAAQDNGVPVKTSLTETGIPFAVSLAQESARSVKFAGTWRTVVSGNTVNPLLQLYSGTVAREAAKAGVSATYSAAGISQIGWVTLLGPTMGIARVSVDGGPAVLVDLYRPAAQRKGWTIPFVTGRLPVGTHTLTISPTGTKNALSTNTLVTVDAFVSM